jgi:hypothetical protein
VDEEHALQRLKWTVLDEAPFHHNSGVAYYWAKRAISDRPEVDLGPIVRRVLLELLDEGLIYFYWGEWDGAGDSRAPDRPTRAEIEADLALGEDAAPTPRTVWFTTTEAGEARLATIPKETLLGYDDRQRWAEFNDRHPDYQEKLSDWLKATDRWVSNGGVRPAHPSKDYPDFPGHVG